MRLQRMKMALLWTLFTTASSRAGAQSPAPTPAPQPVPLAVNGELAPWLQTRGELRTRVEGFTGGGFGEARDAYWMDRFRLNATIRPSTLFAFVAQVQDSRAFDKTAGSQAAPFRNTLDLRMAYGEIGAKHFVRVGRQELAFGEQRLLGSLNWTNTARTFDGVHATFKTKAGQIDGFAASVVTIDSKGFDKSGSGNLISGAYVSLTTVVPRQTVEPYFFWRQARNITAEFGGTAPLHQATTGLRIAGKLPTAFDYSGELAVQTGSVGADDVKAWAGHGVVGKTLKLAPTRIFGEYNYASGDSSGTDGTRGTFDQLYPTGHDKLGLSDQVGWRNVHNVRAGVEVRPTPKWLVASSYHRWWLASATDALYSASGAIVARMAAGTAGRYVGQEIDGQVAYAYSPQLQIGGGYAHLIPGEFLKNTTPGRSYRAPYVMVTYVFLGEKPTIGGRRTQ